MAQRGKMYKPTDADRDFVSRAVKAGTSIEGIAKCLNLHDDTLRKHFRYEITMARQELQNSAIKVLDESLTDGSLDAAKFVLSRVSGWTDRTVTEHTGKDGGAIEVADVSARNIIAGRIAGLAGQGDAESDT